LQHGAGERGVESVAGVHNWEIYPKYRTGQPGLRLQITQFVS
jgi:hypothetical protein